MKVNVDDELGEIALAELRKTDRFSGLNEFFDFILRELFEKFPREQDISQKEQAELEKRLKELGYM